MKCSPADTSKQRKLTYELTIQGNCVIASVRGFTPTQAAGARGDVWDFSPRSRFRLLKLIHQTDWQRFDNWCFITWGFPDEVYHGHEVSSSEHWRAFSRVVTRRHGNVPILWRREWVRRKSGVREGEYAPHFHGLTPLPWSVNALELERILRAQWKIDEHLDVDCRSVWDTDHAAVYVAKYVSKEGVRSSWFSAINAPKFGRSWGIVNRKQWPWHPLRKVVFDNEEQWLQIKEEAGRRYGNVSQDPSTGFTLIGQNALLAIPSMAAATGIDTKTR